MKNATKNTLQLKNSNLNDEIFRSMISSFKIENIIIPDSDAQKIYDKVKAKLKK